eukprot:UN2098
MHVSNSYDPRTTPLTCKNASYYTGYGNTGKCVCVKDVLCGSIDGCKLAQDRLAIAKAQWQYAVDDKHANCAPGAAADALSAIHYASARDHGVAVATAISLMCGVLVGSLATWAYMLYRNGGSTLRTALLSEE